MYCTEFATRITTPSNSRNKLGWTWDGLWTKKDKQTVERELSKHTPYTMGYTEVYWILYSCSTGFTAERANWACNEYIETTTASDLAKEIKAYYEELN